MVSVVWHLILNLSQVHAQSINIPLFQQAPAIADAAPPVPPWSIIESMYPELQGKVDEKIWRESYERRQKLQQDFLDAKARGDSQGTGKALTEQDQVDRAFDNYIKCLRNPDTGCGPMS